LRFAVRHRIFLKGISLIKELEKLNPSNNVATEIINELKKGAQKR
jgi:hypothetical protein